MVVGGLSCEVDACQVSIEKSASVRCVSTVAMQIVEIALFRARGVPFYEAEWPWSHGRRRWLS